MVKKQALLFLTDGLVIANIVAGVCATHLSRIHAAGAAAFANNVGDVLSIATIVSVCAMVWAYREEWLDFLRFP